MHNVRRFETTFAGRPLIVETGKTCELANGSCWVQYGETVVIRLGGPEDASPPAESAPQEEIVIPAGPQEPASVPASGDSGYGVSGYGPESGAAGYQPGGGDSAYGDSAYEEPGDSGYGGDDDDDDDDDDDNDDNDDNDDDGDDGGSGYDD